MKNFETKSTSVPGLVQTDGSCHFEVVDICLFNDGDGDTLVVSSDGKVVSVPFEGVSPILP